MRNLRNVFCSRYKWKYAENMALPIDFQKVIDASMRKKVSVAI